MADFSITGEVKLNSDPAEKSTSKWTVAAGQMIADFAKQASSKLAQVVKSGVDYNATMQSYLTNFKVMLGSEEAAATKLSEIRKMAASTPFSLDNLTSGTQTLLQFGIAADDTTGVLKRLGDISLGNAEKLQTLTRAYGKMSSAQKVTLENVNMMIDAGFNPLNQICAATGESMSDLYKRISDGKVGFNELEAAVEAATSQGGQFYNGMLEASQTFNGRMSTLKDNVSALTGELTSGLFAALGNLVVKLNEVVVSFLDSDKKMAQLKETIGIVTAVVAAAGTAFLVYKGYVAAATVVTNAHKIAQAALNAVMAANPIALVVAALAALAAGLVTAYKTSETFRNAVNSAWTSIKKGAQDAIGTVVDWINELVAKIKGAAAALANLKNGVGAAQEAYDGAYNGYMDDYNQSKLDKAAAKRKALHDERVKQAQEEAAAANAAAAASTSATGTITANADKTAKAAKKAAATVVKSISDTTTTVKDGITRTVETVNETLASGKQQQKKTITETSRQMVDGVLKDVKTITEIAADGTKTVKQTMETVREVAKTVTATTSGFVDGIQTTVQTVTETLTDGTTQQKKAITETYDDVVDGALVTVEKIKTIAADGTVQVSEQIKKSSADTLGGLWKEIQDRANDGVLGTFDDLYTAVKNQDWKGIGLWVAKTIYGGLTADQKKQISDFVLGMVDKLNTALGQMQTSLAAKAWDVGTQLYSGVTHGFSDIWQQTSKLGTTLTTVFQGLKAPLSAAALAVSQGLKSGLLSSFPGIFAGFAGMIGSIGAAVAGMLSAVAAALSSTIFGIPAGLVVAAAAVALVAAIAGIVSKLGGSSGGTSTPSGGTSSSGSSKTVASTTDITTSVAEDGTKTVTKVVTETLQDEAGKLTQKVTKTVTETGTKLVDGVERSCKTVTTYVDDILQRVDTTLEDIAQNSTPDPDPTPEPTPDPTPLPGAGSLEDAITANTKALEKTNSALADMIRQAGSLVLSDNMKLGSTVAASGTAQVAAAASSYHREGDTNITQYIQSKAQSAADLARETRWEADRARAQKR